MNNLDAMADKIRRELSEKDEAREKMLPLCRDSIRFSSTAIRAVHRREFGEAEKQIKSARRALSDAVKAIVSCEELGSTGAVKDAQKEFAEANITLAIVNGKTIPPPEDLGVDVAAYLNGLGEAVGEIRRYLLDGMRRGDLYRGEELLNIMDDIYSILVTMDFPDALTGGLRRTTDMVRGVLEKTRSDLTLTMTQDKLEKRLAGVAGLEQAFPAKKDEEPLADSIGEAGKETRKLDESEIELYKRLEEWRGRKANEENLAPFVIAKNAWLKEIVKMRPAEPAELVKILGFGERRVNKYGREIIALVNQK